MFRWMRKVVEVIDKRKEVELCCANCRDFVPSRNKEMGWGFCPGIYWPYDILSIKGGSFCKNFELKEEWTKMYKVDKKSRPKKEGLIERITAQGIRKRSAMIGDNVMISSN